MKKINCVKKGNRAELEYIKLMKEQGWTMLPRPPRVKFKLSTDYFGFWDTIGYRDNQWVVVQVKSNRATDKKLYIEAARNLPENTLAVMVIRKDGGDWQVINLRE